MKRLLLIFGLGVAVALVAGWEVFPHLLYAQKQQPLEFRHKMHSEKSGITDCTECHVLRGDGQFAGTPSTEKCGSCHAEQIGQDAEEAKLVVNFVKPGREVPWLEYSAQPANVWFSHAIHLRRANLKCEDCHGAFGESDRPKVYEVNRISGYSRDIWGHSISRLRRAPHDGMKMSDCEDCHRGHHVDVGCLGCHK